MPGNRNKDWLWLVAVFFLIVTWGMAPVAPASASLGYEGTAWKLSQAFTRAIRDQEAQFRYYLLPGLAFILFLFGLIIYWYRSHKKLSASVTWNISQAAGSNTQRDWMRLSIEQEILFAREEDEKYKRAKVINMSGGGLLFATGEELEKNDELKIILEIAPGEELKLNGKVVRITKNDDSDNGNDNKNRNQNRYLIGLQFLNIKKGEQDKIVKRILEKQQDYVIMEKRKAKGECVICGRPLPEADVGVKIYCPKCSVYHE